MSMYDEISSPARGWRAGRFAAVLAIAVTAGAFAQTPSFSKSDIFFELNHTDGDLGIHAKIDGDAWKSLEIEDPNERSMLKIRVKGRLRRQGLTEIFMESAEPTFDELDPEVFFARFPEGTYEIEGLSLEGEEIGSAIGVSKRTVQRGWRTARSATPASCSDTDL